jgi:membrane protease YdiL (CAAX protease family)
MQASASTTAPADQPGDRYEVTWGGREVLIGIALVILGSLVVSIVISPIVDEYGLESAEAQRAYYVGGMAWRLVSFLSIYMMAGGSDLAFPRLGFRMPPGMTWGKVAMYVVLGFLAVQAVFVIYGLTVDAIGYEPLIPDSQVEPVIFDHTDLIILLGLAVVVQAPIYEELLVRGFLFGWARKAFGVLPALISTSLLFGLVHGQWALIIPVTLIGMLLAFAYHKTNTLYVPLGIHFVVNTVSFLGMVYIPETR